MTVDKKFRTMPSLLSTMVFMLAVFVMTLFGSGVTYGLNHSSNITSSETWHAANNPHIVTTAIHVYSSATLTIEKGCVVKFDSTAGLYIGYYSAATLNAVGTEDVPITFTSNTGSPAPNDWRGIVFFNSTVDGSTIMDYCTVEYGGNGGENSNINCNQASPTIQNCTIRHSDAYGIYCDSSSAPTLTNNTISNNSIYPITLYCGLLDSNVTGNTGSGNGTDAIEVRGGSITSSRTWIVQGFYFNVTGSIHVYSGATLTIPPGCLVEFNGGTGLYIGYHSAATLIADGTSGSPITFTSHAATPAPNDWQGIVFFNSTDDSATIMDYCTVEYGGYDSYQSNINCNNASPTIQNCTIRHSDQYGIYCDNYSAPTLTNNTISNNGIYPITEFCDRLDSNVTGNTGSGNGRDAIEVRGGSMTSSHTWIPQDFYFNVTTTEIYVYSDATLTISPGCLVKFEPGMAIYIGYYSAAALIADGTSGSPITFTSNASTPAPGDWRGIVFFNSAVDGSTIMDYCIVEYGGFDSYDSNINCNEASPTIQRCMIRNSDGNGVYTTGSGAHPLITCSTITNNVNGVYAYNNSNPTVENCSVSGNTSYGVYNNTSAITLDAENNWWGHSSGPSGVGPGTGVAVSNYVDYTPWLTAFDSCLETIVLSPGSATNPIGTQHTVTATIKNEAPEPIPDMVVSFEITSGPHAGVTGTDTTAANGQATFTYTGTQEGTDIIEASFVDFHGRTITSGPVTKTWETATAIDLKSFTARSGIKGKVGITWETATEVDNAGFNLYRAKSADGDYAKINDSLIYARGDAVSGASYSYVDIPGKGTFYYKLEDVDYYGVSAMHGPEKVRVRSDDATIKRQKRK
ncbi:MAG: right-handed parallel beta-helix repeat-containing protein [Candidatus Brocadia sp.]|nr:right-handed parallel beta-helix repeat-containing protein [Candidatus Brocadia sp.]